MEEQIGKSRTPRTIGAALHLPGVFLWLLVFWYLLILELRPVVYALGIAFLLVVVAAKIFPRGSRAQLVKIRNILFYAVASLGLLALFHLSFLTQPALSAGLCVAAALIISVFRSRRLVGVLCILFCAVVPFIARLPLLTVACALYAALFAVAAWKRPHWLGRRAPIFLLLSALALSAQLYDFYQGQPVNESGRILTQRGVRPIYLSSNPTSELNEALGNECRFIVENCDGSLLLGGRDQHRGLYLLRNGKLIKTPVRQVSDYVDFDCSSNIIWAGEFHRSMIWGLDAETGTREKRIIGIPFGGTSRVRFDKQANRLYASRDDTPRILLYDLEAGTPRVARFSHPVVDFDFSEEIDALFIARWGGVFYRYGLTNLEPQGKMITPDWLIHFVLDPENLVGYVTKFYAGRVLKVNLSTLEVEDSIRLKPGLRFPLLDKERGLLFVSNFITGQCDVLEAKTLRRLDSRYFGSRLRATSLSRDGRILYAPSSQGGFAWDLATLR